MKSYFITKQNNNKNERRVVWKRQELLLWEQQEGISINFNVFLDLVLSMK